MIHETKILTTKLLKISIKWNKILWQLWQFWRLFAFQKLKVSQFQKQMFLSSFEPKTKEIIFLNSALASKMRQIKKMKPFYYINQGVFNTIEALFFIWPILDP